MLPEPQSDGSLDVPSSFATSPPFVDNAPVSLIGDMRRLRARSGAERRLLVEAAVAVAFARSRCTWSRCGAPRAC
jgi:hypothetical protein